MYCLYLVLGTIYPVFKVPVGLKLVPVFFRGSFSLNRELYTGTELSDLDFCK